MAENLEIQSNCLAIASTPLHILYIIEFASKYCVENLDLIILVKRKTDEPQIDKIIKEIKWHSVQWIDATGKFANNFIAFYELLVSYELNTAPNGYNFGIFADYGRSILANIQCQSVFWLGDGTKLLYEVSETHESKPNRYTLHRIANSLSKLLLNQRLSLNLEPTIFSPFDISQKKLIHNDFSWIRNKYSELSNCDITARNEIVYFFGSYFSEVESGSLMPDETYITYMEQISTYYKQRQISVIYIPHRHESSIKLAQISNIPNIQITKFEYPSEYQFLIDQRLPSRIAAFCSTCIFNFYYIFKSIEIKSFYTDFSKFNSKQSDRMEIFYDHIKTLIGSENVIDLNTLENLK